MDGSRRGVALVLVLWIVVILGGLAPAWFARRGPQRASLPTRGPKSSRGPRPKAASRRCCCYRGHAGTAWNHEDRKDWLNTFASSRP